MMDKHRHWPMAPIVWHGHDQSAVCRECGQPIYMVNADSTSHGPWELDLDSSAATQERQETP